MQTVTQKFGDDFATAAQVVALADPDARVRTRVILGPNSPAVIAAELFSVYNIVSRLGMVVSVIPDPENTPEVQQVLVLLSGSRDQTVGFNEAMAEARAR